MSHPAISIFLMLLLTCAWNAFGSVSGESMCEPIKISLCKSMGYNMTGMPNFADSSLQQSHASSQLETFIPLIQSDCSRELQFFLCSVYAPMCVTDMVTPQKLIGPCRPLCDRVQQKCASIMEKHQISWPEVLNCRKFPVLNDHSHMCMKGPGADGSNGVNSNQKEIDQSNLILNALQTNPIFFKKVKEKMSNTSSKIPDFYKNYVGLLEDENFVTNYQDRSINCGDLPSKNYVYVSKYGKCIRRCQIDDEENVFNDNTMDIVLAFAVILSSSLIFLAMMLVLMDTSNSFYYPEKVLIFLVMSYLGLVPGYSIRLFVPREDVYCQTTGDFDHLTQDGQRNSLCFASFLFHYFFFLAISAWFAVFNFCLILANSFNWQQKQFLKFVSVFHMFSWGVPAIFTVVAIITNHAEADELTGLCFIGSQKEENLLFFILIPEGVLIVLSFVLLLIFIVGGYTTTLKKPKKKMGSEMSFIKKVSFSTMFLFIQLFIYIIFLLEYLFKSEWIRISSRTMPSLWCMRLILLHFNAIVCSFFIIFHAKPRVRWIGIFRLEKDNFPHVGYSQQKGTREMETNFNMNMNHHPLPHHQLVPFPPHRTSPQNPIIL